jgi:hypothetical protein
VRNALPRSSEPKSRPSKQQTDPSTYVYIRLHGVTSQEIAIFIVTSLRTSNPAYFPRLRDDPYMLSRSLLLTDNRHCLHCGPASLPWAVTSPKSRLCLLEGSSESQCVTFYWNGDRIRETGVGGGDLLFPLDHGLEYCGPQADETHRPDLSRTSLFTWFICFYVGYLTTLSV